MRIAIFHNLIFGGGGRVFLEFTRELSQRHEIDVYTIDSAVMDSGVKSRVKNIYAFPFKRFFLKRPLGFLNVYLCLFNLYRLDKLYRKIARIIDKRNYDLVFIHASFFDYSHAPGILRFLSTPNIYFCQEPFARFYEPDIFAQRYNRSSLSIYHYFTFYPLILQLYRFGFKLYDRFNARKADLILCNSNYSKEYIFREYGVVAEVNYLGVDTERYRPIEVPKENLVISCGYLTYKKGHDFVIEALAKIPSEKRPRLTIVCFSFEGTPYYDKLKKYLTRLAHDCSVALSFSESPEDLEVAVLYNKARVTACAYRRDPFGLVSLESMACQTPVVAVKEGGLAESLVHGEVGLLTERDINKFSDAIVSLFSDEDTRNRMGIRARQYVLEKWTWKHSTENLEKFFIKISRRRSAASNK